MKDEFNKAAQERFGSGWAWLYLSKNGDLKIMSTPNQDNPLMDLADVKGTPVFIENNLNSGCFRVSEGVFDTGFIPI